MAPDAAGTPKAEQADETRGWRHRYCGRTCGGPDRRQRPHQNAGGGVGAGDDARAEQHRRWRRRSRTETGLIRPVRPIGARSARRPPRSESCRQIAGKRGLRQRRAAFLSAAACMVISGIRERQRRPLARVRASGPCPPCVRPRAPGKRQRREIPRLQLRVDSSRRKSAQSKSA